MRFTTPQLVLIPGLAADARMWRAQTAALAEWQPVVATAHAQQDSIEAMAAAVLDQHPGVLLLCGASMGGMVAMEAARQAPTRVRGLALLGTNARPETPEMRAVREAAVALFAQGRVEEVIRPNVGFAFHAGQAADPALVQAYLDFVLDAGADTLIRQNRAVMARPDARLHLPSVRCATLVMCGENDVLTPPECSREIAGLVPRAELILLPECGHMLTMEQPEAVNTALIGWLEGFRRPGG
ncbi:MAG: alpha/beta fold hydrolase [Lysobacteraceae bacterium]|nr:MAG: alpha/beta fold hydrolase [Xanthomonadaceae bacterium]